MKTAIRLNPTPLPFPKIDLFYPAGTLKIEFIACPNCEAEFPSANNEPEVDCPDCESRLRNPNFKPLEVSYDYGQDA